MTVAELRELLETLPPRFDETEVVMYAHRGLCHIDSVELDRQRIRPELWRSNDLELPPRERLERKVRLRAATHFRSARLWYEEPPEWRLLGWWPKEAADIGLDSVMKGAR